MCSPCIQHIVGREVERDILQRTYDQVQQGRGALVCINGDVGLGKTALVDAFVEDLLRNGQTCHLARARCSDSFTENEPLMPWIENVSALAEEPTVREALVKTAPTWHREISHSGSSAPRQMKRELLDFYKEISSIHPVIIVLDDFHWADVGSIDLLAFLAPRLESLRVMVIVCYRQTEMKIKSHLFLQVRSDLLSRGACTEILLARLSRTDVEQYVALEQPNVQYAPDYAETLHAKSEGNPMFMRELLHESNGRSESIQHLIQSRLDRLDDTHHQLLVTASVQGREFDSAVLAAAMQMNSQDVEESLQVLDDVYGLIRRTREEELPDGKFTVRYRFAYQLYQEACYSSLAPTRKASLSASLAEAFLTYYGN
jgi:predicted ATPase